MRGGRRWILRLGGTAAGAVLYLAMVGSLDPWAVVQGVAVSLAALLVARQRLPSAHRWAGTSWRELARLAMRSARDVVAGSWKVGLAAAGLRSLPRPAWVEVPVGEQPPAHLDAAAILETLSPGTYLVDFDEERNVMLFHVFDADDAEALRRSLLPALGGTGGDGGATGGAG